MSWLLLRGVEAERFLPFHDRVRLRPERGLTVITGPNGAGKTSLGLCLDLARAAIGRWSGDPATGGLYLYSEAGHDGAGSFMVALDLDLDQVWERKRVWAFVCAAYACDLPSNHDEPPPDERDATVREWLVEDSLVPLYSGRLLIRHEGEMVRPWFVAWEFTHADETWHVVIQGNGDGQLRRGSADPWSAPTGSQNLRPWLLDSKPQDKSQLDFRVALERMKQPVTFSVRSQAIGSGRIPASLRDLAPELEMAEYGNRNFSFEYVLAAVLRRQLVLTDNRRLPIRVRFTHEELQGPVDLRDGANVAAKLFHLKNGDTPEQERFEQVQATFKDLTGRRLKLRARHVSAEGQAAGMLIEPIAVGRSHQPVSLAGAGVQEALVLSTLLDDQPGRILVLDEPAVNLEPTMQRRLLRQLRDRGQCLVITHHPDLVPVEEPADLNRVIRVAPGKSGSRVIRPDLGPLAEKESQKWLRLLAPADVRALLFVPAVILCEGPTEVAALSRWWRRTNMIGLRDPEAANMPLISVDSQTRFGAYVRYLDAFGVPWAIVADGPALRGDSTMAKQLLQLDHEPRATPADPDDYSGWRNSWESVGVFTVATEFGDDGNKGGEFEAFLSREDARLLKQIQDDVGRGAKPVVGAYFASEHTDPPQEVLELYEKIASWFGPTIVPEEGRGTTQSGSR